MNSYLKISACPRRVVRACSPMKEHNVSNTRSNVSLSNVVLRETSAVSRRALTRSRSYAIGRANFAGEHECRSTSVRCFAERSFRRIIGLSRCKSRPSPLAPSRYEDPGRHRYAPVMSGIVCRAMPDTWLFRGSFLSPLHRGFAANYEVWCIGVPVVSPAF